MANARDVNIYLSSTAGWVGRAGGGRLNELRAQVGSPRPDPGRSPGTHAAHGSTGRVAAAQEPARAAGSRHGVPEGHAPRPDRVLRAGR